MDRAPIVAIAGQGATTRLHKESHQILDLVSMFQPITKYATQILEPGDRSGDRAQGVQGGADREARRHLHRLPRERRRDDDRQEADQGADGRTPPKRPTHKVDEAAKLITARQGAGHPRRQRRHPPGRGRLAGDLRRSAAHPGGQHLHGQGRDAVHQRALARHHRPEGARPAVVRLREGRRGHLRRLRHGRVPPRHVEPRRRQDDHPHRCAARRGGRALHRRGRRARRHPARRCARIALHAKPQTSSPFKAVRKAIVADRAEYSNDTGFPVKPQKIVWDLREVLGPDDIAISDVGAHKMWMSRMYRAERPNTCIISNGFAAMGIAVPGAIAAKLAYPDRKVVAVTGDAGFMMNSQEIETAMRMKTPFVILIWNDSEYGLITWHQLRHFGRPSHIDVQEPGLRQVRRELRRQGLSRRAGRRPAADAEEGARGRHGGHHRLPGRLRREHVAHRQAQGDEVAAVTDHGRWPSNVSRSLERTACR